MKSSLKKKTKKTPLNTIVSDVYANISGMHDGAKKETPPERLELSTS
jgi:hypothetical protein